jgi:mono/diheme cytochrome c family protein
MSDCSVPFASKRRKNVLLVGLLAALFACAGQIPRPTSLQAQWAAQRWPGVTPEGLAQGRTLYIAKCSGCHTLRVPTKYSEDRWPSLLDKMQKRAKISDDEKAQILHYVLSVKQNS